MAALAHETRVAILGVLADAGAEGLPGFEIAARTKTSETLTSHHLRILAQAKIVTPTKRGRTILHSLNADRLARLSAAVGALAQPRPLR